MEKVTIDTERLLEHRGFLLRLARSLTRDEASAEDLVQETWLTALRRPPRHDRGLRAWLGRVARGLASNRSRATRSREERERRSARPEALDTDKELEETLELQRDIVDALRELREPYRRTLYLRYYRDLAPGEIARREELPLPTVKSHLQRGLVELRRSLDRRHGGQRALWLAPLAGFLEKGTETTAAAASVAGWIGGMIAVQKLVLAVVVLAIAGGVWFVVNRDDVGVNPEGNRRVEEAAATGARPDATVEVARPETASEAVRSEVEPEGGATSRSGTDPAVVTGRLLFENGAPAPGIEVTMGRPYVLGPKTPGRYRRLDPPPPVHTDLAGGFEFRLGITEPVQLSVEAHRLGHVPVHWRSRTVEPAARLPLETKTLAPAGSLLVQVRNAEGELVVGTWRISVAPIDREDPDWENLSIREELDRFTGDVRLEGLPAGRARVTAYCPLVRRGLSQVIEVRPGEERPLLFTYEGPPLDSRIVVDSEIEPRVANTSVAREAWRLQREGEAPRVPKAPPYREWYIEILFEELPAGPYTLECLDPRFEPWRREGIEPGSVVRARLRGRSAIRLEVIGANGEPVRDYALFLQGTRKGGWSHRVSLREPDREEPEDGVYRGLIPTELDASVPETVLSSGVRKTSWTIEVQAAGYSPVFMALDRLLPDEITPLTVQLDQGATISGRVRSADGEVPAGEVQVILTQGSLPAAHSMGVIGTGRWQGQAIPQAKAAAMVDDQGRFSFERVAPGEWTLRAVQGPWFTSDETLTVATGESAEVELVMPPAATLVVHFVAPEEADLSEVTLELTAERSTTTVTWSGDWSGRHAAMKRGEPCLFEPLRAGDYYLRLIVPSRDRGGSTHYGSNRVLEDVSLTPGEQRVLHCDLTACYPAFLGLRVTLDGVPRFDVFTAPHPLGDSEITRATGEGNLWGLTSDTGEDYPQLILPGPYGIDVYSGDGHWGYTLPEPIDLRPAETRIVELELNLLEGAVLLVDDTTEKPLGDRSVAWFLGEPNPRLSIPMQRLTTDAAGRLELSFPAGEIGLSLEGYEPILLRWPPEAGLELRLRASE